MTTCLTTEPFWNRFSCQLFLLLFFCYDFIPITFGSDFNNESKRANTRLTVFIHYKCKGTIVAMPDQICNVVDNCRNAVWLKSIFNLESISPALLSKIQICWHKVLGIKGAKQFHQKKLYQTLQVHTTRIYAQL